MEIPNQIEDMGLAEGLITYAKSHVEKQVIRFYSTGVGYQEVANDLGLTYDQVRHAVRRVKSRAALQGYAPEYHLNNPVPETHYVKGVSTLYKDGQPVMQWIKSDAKKEDFEKFAREVIDSLKADLPKIIVPEAKTNYRTDVLVSIPLGDPHIGMHAWKEETGADFDLKIAEKDLCAAVERLVNSTPPAAECLIANLGDFFHADNMDAQTWRSKHALDVDSRWPKVLRVGIRVMRYCIEAAARRHKKITVINAIGNHDDHSSMLLSVALSEIYENDPRINIIDAPTATHYYRFHSNLIGVHHGHGIKMENLPLQMASDRPLDWGETKNRYWYTGHIHHDSKKEIQSVVVESFRTLAARDAWAASKGYKSGRDMKAIVLHKDYGEIERHTVSVEML
jgi:hypothetical protein